MATRSENERVLIALATEAVAAHADWGPKGRIRAGEFVKSVAAYLGLTTNLNGSDQALLSQGVKKKMTAMGYRRVLVQCKAFYRPPV